MSPDDILEQAADLFRYKKTIYKDNYHQIGYVMRAMFPDGLTVKSVADWNRLHLFMLSVVKLTRYSNNYDVGHPDSLDDLTVYASMLRSLDLEAIKAEEKEILTGKKNDKA